MLQHDFKGFIKAFSILLKSFGWINLNTNRARELIIHNALGKVYKNHKALQSIGARGKSTTLRARCKQRFSTAQTITQMMKIENFSFVLIEISKDATILWKNFPRKTSN